MKLIKRGLEGIEMKDKHSCSVMNNSCDSYKRKECNGNGNVYYDRKDNTKVAGCVQYSFERGYLEKNERNSVNLLERKLRTDLNLNGIRSLKVNDVVGGNGGIYYVYDGLEGIQQKVFYWYDLSESKIGVGTISEDNIRIISPCLVSFSPGPKDEVSICKINDGNHGRRLKYLQKLGLVK